MRKTNTLILSIALKQTKSGPRSSGTPFLVYLKSTYRVPVIQGCSSLFLYCLLYKFIYGSVDPRIPEARFTKIISF